jgi:hypothetical protein
MVWFIIGKSNLQATRKINQNSMRYKKTSLAKAIEKSLILSKQPHELSQQNIQAHFQYCQRRNVRADGFLLQANGANSDG